MPAFNLDNKLLNKAIMDQCSEGITVADVTGNYIFVNPAFCKMMGYSEEELLQMTVFDMKAPEQNHSSFEESKKSKDGLPIRVLLQRKDGSTFISEVLGQMIEVDGNTQVLGTIRDIHKRVMIEEALIKSEERYQTAMEVANDGIWDWHLDTNVVEFDKRYYKMAGYDRFDFEPTYEAWENHVHPDDLNSARDAVLQYLAGEIKVFDIAFRFLCRDGNYIWVRGRGKIVSYDEFGKPLRFIGTHADITREKEHEAKILHQAHFDALTNLPNRFLSIDRLE
jgi:PAS domain S-box-containing protein